MKKMLSILIALAMLLSVCGVGLAEETLDEFKAHKYRVAYILNSTMSDIFQMAFDAAGETAEALGMEIDFYTTNQDNVLFQNYVETCANQGYDAMFLSHGNQESAYDLVTMLVERGIKVVTFDTQFVDESGEKVKIDGVTQMFQDDAGMADMLLDYVCNTLYPEKVAAGEKVNILKIWRGPGISPFDRRQTAYLKYEEAGLINTLEVLGPSDPANGEASMNTVINSVLPKYPKGAIDAIWCCYDAYARGAYTAMLESDRLEIPLVSVDISNQDINFMRDGNESWKACATVHFETVGEQGIRMCAMKLHGDEVEDWYELTPSLVAIDSIRDYDDVNVLNLGEYVEDYGVNDDHIAEWMKPALAK